MAVTATFDFNATEHYRATRAVYHRTPLRFMPWAFAAVILGLLAWNILPNWDEASSGGRLGYTLPYIIFLAIWLPLIPFMQRRAARKLPDRDPSARGAQERSVDVTGFHSRGNGVALDVPWHVMPRAVETEEFFLFFYNKQCAYYFPKRVLSAAQLTDVRALARTNLGDKARLLTT